MKKFHNSTLKNLRVAGILVLINLALPILNWALILSGFTTGEYNLAELSVSDELLLRLNIYLQIISSLLILLLGFVFYIILKETSSYLSLFALILKSFEALTILILSIMQFIALFMLISEQAEAQSFFIAITNNYIKLTSFAGIFMSINMLIWTYLFMKSGFIPKAIAMFGIISFALVIIYDSMMIFCIKPSPPLIIQLVGTVPMLLFQLILSSIFLLKNK